MKKSIMLLGLCFLFIVPMNSQAQVTKAEFEAHQNAVNKSLENFESTLLDSLRQIGERVNNGAITLDIAKAYSDKADKTYNNFFNIITWGIGILAFLGLGSLWAIYEWIFIRYKKVLNERLREAEKTLRRILETEDETIFLKENSGILILDKDHNSAQAFQTLKKSILKNFTNAKEAKLSSLDEFEFDIFSKNSITSNNKLKVVVLNDRLLEESKEIQKAFLNKLIIHKVGLVLFGQIRLSDIEPDYHYLAFANQPYSVYANLNHLLKYMRIAENIEIK